MLNIPLLCNNLIPGNCIRSNSKKTYYSTSEQYCVEYVRPEFVLVCRRAIFPSFELYLSTVLDKQQRQTERHIKLQSTCNCYNPYPCYAGEGISFCKRL